MGSNRQPPNQPPVQKLHVQAELRIFFRDRPSQPVIFKQVVYQFQAQGTDMILTVQEVADEDRTHVFHWSDIFNLRAVPTQLERVTQ